MRAQIKKQGGFIVSVELLFILVFVIMGVVIGWSSLKDAVVNELADTANAIDALNQTYSYAGLTGHSATVAGTTWRDGTDYCQDTSNDNTGNAVYDRCIAQLVTNGDGDF